MGWGEGIVWFGGVEGRWFGGEVFRGLGVWGWGLDAVDREGWGLWDEDFWYGGVGCVAFDVMGLWDSLLLMFARRRAQTALMSRCISTGEKSVESFLRPRPGWELVTVVEIWPGGVLEWAVICVVRGFETLGREVVWKRGDGLKGG